METTLSSAAEVVESVTALVPMLRERARGMERERRLDDEVVGALEEAGVYRVRVPVRLGGLDATAEDMLRISSRLALGDGATSWTVAVSWIPAWMLGFFPDDVQDEVFGHPNTRVCGTLTPGGQAVPADGGMRITGTWHFVSGARHSHWQQVIAMAPTPDGTGAYPVIGLIPIGELTLVDDWYTSGLSASGSITTIADDVFVPAERLIPLTALSSARPSGANAGSPIYRVPFSAYGAIVLMGSLTGLAAAAVERFQERLATGKGITFTNYAQQRDAPLTHLQLADAVMRRDEAEFHALRVARTVDEKGARSEPWSNLERALARADRGAAADRACEVADLLDSASGGGSVQLEAPSQRIYRDVRAIRKHALVYPPSAFELLGRLLCGLGPNTTYL